ncbi:hypothetical protein [Lactiplantibacillus plantarum]|uniref:hypothetical protein n=1 Tax=Lactiplantibacillus plantarum TaxID=1590 RepID=UPI0008FB01B9|nr:hypothetical protein [Lactiplantibacillus plantarum]APB84648.1 hypothetical protein BL295_01945 [Lactiplantibacillus plantarum]UQK33359.1 hypothetical protein MKM38_09855 [Lactiplantibacillus plantarum]
MTDKIGAAFKKFCISVVTLTYSLKFNSGQINLITKLFNIFGFKNKTFTASISLFLAALVSAILVEFVIFVVGFLTPKFKRAIKVPITKLTFKCDGNDIDELVFSAANEKGCNEGKTIKYTFDILPRGKVSFWLLSFLRASLIIKFNPEIVQIADAGDFNQEQDIIDGRRIRILLIDNFSYKNVNETFTKDLKVVPLIGYTKNSDISFAIHCGRQFIRWIPLGFLTKFSGGSLRIWIKR